MGRLVERENANNLNWFQNTLFFNPLYTKSIALKYVCSSQNLFYKYSASIIQYMYLLQAPSNEAKL